MNHNQFNSQKIVWGPFISLHKSMTMLTKLGLLKINTNKVLTMKISDYVKQKEKELEKVSTARSFEEKLKRKHAYRNDADIDYARIIYSSAFRRLQGKMQLFIPDNIHFYRNRLTHSMEVSQIARCIAKKFKMADTLTVRSCALAHDFGNPPFGHAGEVVLSNLSKKCNYEGNAQTFRILDHIEEKHHNHNGLNLTLRTLLGVVKYPFPKSINPKKYLYDKDFELVDRWSKKNKVILKTIDCEIMDIADEIAYAAHDLEDALRLKYFTIDDLIYEFETTAYKDSLPSFKKIVKKSKKFGEKSETYNSSEEFSILFKKELTSMIIDILISDLGLVPDSASSFKIGFMNHDNLAKGLKTLTFNAIKRNPDIYRYELMGENVLKGLFEVFMDNRFNKDLKLLPAEYRDLEATERTILDYIGGMMDSYAINQYCLYFGKTNLEKLYL